MADVEMFEDDWAVVRELLPRDLEESARSFGVLQRQREIRSGEDLLRLALWYGVGGLSLRNVAAQAEILGLADLSDVAVLYRLRTLGPWLAHLLGQMLMARGAGPGGSEIPVHLVDATTIEEPGGRSGERLWRLHLRLDLSQDRMVSVELTDHHGGETLRRHELTPGSIVIGDRAYGRRQGMAHILASEAHGILRISPKQFPLETESGDPFDPVEWARRTLEPGDVSEIPVRFRLGDEIHRVRLIAHRHEPEAAARSRKRARRKAQKDQRRLSQGAWLAAECRFLVTTLPADRFPTRAVGELYELRWRVELYFKRLKTLLALDELRAHDPELVRSYILANLIGALILEDLLDQVVPFPPPEAVAERLAQAQSPGVFTT